MEKEVEKEMLETLKDISCELEVIAKALCIQVHMNYGDERY